MQEAVVTSPRIVVPQQPRWHQRLAAWLIYLFLRALVFTMRFRWTDRSGLRDGSLRGPVIYCIWHNRLALAGHTYLHIREPTQSVGLAALISASRDGGLLQAVLRRFGMTPVRGSSSRRGPQALRELTTWARKGYDIAITPDGPRGPRYVAQSGVIALAQLTGHPLIPAALNISGKIRVKSWDQFQIPLPFSRAELIFGKPLLVPREASEAAREVFRGQLEQMMKNIAVE